MKRNYMMTLIALFTLMLVLLTGCAHKQPAVAMVNPMTEVTSEEMIQKSGVPIYAPSGAEDIHYYTITDGDHTIAQIDFKLNGKEYTHRAVAGEMNMTELSGVYFTKFAGGTVEVSYCDGALTTQGKTAVLFWEDKVPGICYTISCTDCDDANVLLKIAEDVFVPAQGDSGVGYAEMPTEYADVAGTFTDANGNTVTLNPTGEHTFDVEVSIVRLAQFTGTAVQDPICVDMTLTDPNNGPLYAEFYQAQDGTFTLIISESTWNLLESETQFTGFTK